MDAKNPRSFSMNSGLISDLERIVGSGSVSEDTKVLDRFSGDALGAFRAFRVARRLSARPRVVVWPTSAEQVSGVLRFANRHTIPVVPYGGGTGVMGAAAPVDACIILNLQRLDSILSVEREDMTARVQAGMVLEDAALAFGRAGLVLGHDPWSRPIATIGGAISTDGIGYTAAKYGSMGEQVLGLEVVLPDGEVVRTRGVPKSSFGPSLNDLFIGSEGTLGVITEATVRAFPQPEHRRLRAVVFPDFESGFRAVSQLYVEGVRPAMVDYGQEPMSSPEAVMGDATLYLAFEGFKEDVDAHDRRAMDICVKFRGRAGDPPEVERFWNSRHSSGERYKQNVLESPDPAAARKRHSAYRMDYLHVALPVSRVLEYRRRCSDLLASTRVLVREWSLWARPEFFSFLIVEEEDEGLETSQAMGDAVDEVLRLAHEFGGTMEYCHGVGIKLAHLMASEMDAGLSAIRRIKRALDPNDILNPGKLTG